IVSGNRAARYEYVIRQRAARLICRLQPVGYRVSELGVRLHSEDGFRGPLTWDGMLGDDATEEWIAYQVDPGPKGAIHPILQRQHVGSGLDRLFAARRLEKDPGASSLGDRGRVGGCVPEKLAASLLQVLAQPVEETQGGDRRRHRGDLKDRITERRLEVGVDLLCASQAQHRRQTDAHAVAGDLPAHPICNFCAEAAVLEAPS